MGNVGEILYSALTNRMLMYDAGKGKIKEEVRELYKNLFRKLEILEIESGVYYRAHKIDKQKDVIRDKKIVMTKEGKVCGFDKDSSGVPLQEEDRKPGRLNRQGEPVLYIADDIITCLHEVKPALMEYISVARFEIVNPIRILNFTPFYKTDYINYFNADVVHEFEQKGYNCQELFCGIQEILTMPDFKDEDYKISNKIADIIKEVSHELGVDGISYKSYYTVGENIALWNYDNAKFINDSSQVYSFCKDSPCEIFLQLNDGDVICKEPIQDNIVTDINTHENRKELIYNLFH